MIAAVPATEQPAVFGPVERCGAHNDVLDLTCDREPHTEGAHFQLDDNGLSAWPGDNAPEGARL